MNTTTDDESVVAATDTASSGARRRLLVAGVAVVVAVLGSLSGLVPGLDAIRPPADGAPAAPLEGAVVDVASLTASIGAADPGYVRLGFAAVLAEGTDPSSVEARFPLLKDAALTELSRRSLTDLRTPEGMDQLRAALTERARRTYPDGEVVRIVLTELLIQ